MIIEFVGLENRLKRQNRGRENQYEKEEGYTFFMSVLLS
jgi:hypothetical protein